MFFLKTIKKRMRAYEKLFDLLRDEVLVLARALEHQEDEHAELAVRVAELEEMYNPPVVTDHADVTHPGNGRLVEMAMTRESRDKAIAALYAIHNTFGMSGATDLSVDVPATAESLITELNATRAACAKAEDALAKATSSAREANNNCDALRARLAKAEADWRRECELRTNLEKQIDLLREKLINKKAE